MDDDGRVEERARVPERGANDQHGKQIARRDDELIDGALDGVEQCILEQEIVNRVGGQPKLGKDEERCFDRVTLLGEPDGFGKIGLDVRGTRARNTGSYSHELVAVERAKIGGHSSNIQRLCSICTGASGRAVLFS